MKEKWLIELKRQIYSLLLNNKNNDYDYKYNDSLSKKVNKVLEELENNHNTSWAVEMFMRNIDNLDSNAIIYRGNKIKYRDMFINAFKFAKALKQLGYKKGDEIPVCSSNIPEFVYMFLATSFIGAKINVVGEWFDQDFLKQILNKTNSDYIFVSDDVYGDIKDTISQSNIKRVVMFSLTDSLKKVNGSVYDPYHIFDEKMGGLEDKRKNYLSNSKSKKKTILSTDDFNNIGMSYGGNVIADCKLDDACAITYTSGTTSPGCPKGCIHSNRSYITLSRFKESDVSGMPSMHNLTVLAHIPTYTHMELSCAISDTLYEKCTLAMEPFYNADFFSYSLLINKPNFVPAGVGFWMKLCKLLSYDPAWQDINMPYLMIPTVTGEGCTKGEEKFFNDTAKAHKFGLDKLPVSVTFSIGGGTSESSGIFVTLFRSLQEKNHFGKIIGLTPHKFVDLEVLDSEGNYCKEGQAGLLVANSPCDMLGYTNENFNNKVCDATGKKWSSLGTLAYKSDSDGRIIMKGRTNSYIELKNGLKVPYYSIEDIILKDIKNIMSCTLVMVGSEYVAHIELQPTSDTKISKILEECSKRLCKSIPYEVLNKLYFRIRSYEESFVLAPSGKRDFNALMSEGITDKCIPCNNYYNKQKIRIKK